MIFTINIRSRDLYSSRAGDENNNQHHYQNREDIPVKKSTEWPIPVKEPSEDTADCTENASKDGGDNSKHDAKNTGHNAEQSSGDADPNRKREYNENNDQYGRGGTSGLHVNWFEIAVTKNRALGPLPYFQRKDGPSLFLTVEK